MSNAMQASRVDQPLGLAVFLARSHPDRASLSEEMHLRRLPGLRSPARGLQVVLLAGEAEMLAVFGRLRDRAGAQPGGGSRYLTWREGGASIAWERHTEFMTMTFLWEGASDGDFDFEGTEAARSLLLALPGEVIRATKILLRGRDDGAPSEADLARFFAADDLVSSEVADGRVRVWSDFRLHSDGFGRLLVLDQGLERGEAALLLQRLQELGNYRKMALLGLPVARQAGSEVTALERRLAEVARGIAAGARGEDAILRELLDLSVEIARLSAETRHRMSASSAYSQLCAERMRQLQVRPIAGFRSLQDFTERRLSPAVRTCEAFTVRLDDLSRQAAWASALLRTRIDTRLSGQQRDLLASMDRRTELQLQLQHMVEWVSAGAVAYYLVGLLHYGFGPFSRIAGLDKDAVLAIAAPVALGVVILAMNVFRRRFRSTAAASSPQAGND